MPRAVAYSETWRMEEFSRAYVRAVAAVAGCEVTEPTVDIDSIDMTFARRTAMGPVRSPKMDAQLKATALDPLSGPSLSFELSIKNYNELRATDFMVPRILIVVVVPPLLADWLGHTEVELAMRWCGYWTSLRGQPAVNNVASRTVQIDRTKVFDVAGLDGIMNLLQQGNQP